MILEAILLAITCGVMGYAAQHDIKYREIRLYTLIAIAVLGFMFFIVTSQNVLLLLYAELAFTMIFLIPAIFGMGWGDMLLFWSLGFFFTDSSNLHIFLLFSFITAGIMTVYYIKKDGLLQDKEKFKSIHFPLIPAVFIGFIIFAIKYLLF